MMQQAFSLQALLVLILSLLLVPGFAGNDSGSVPDGSDRVDAAHSGAAESGVRDVGASRLPDRLRPAEIRVYMMLDPQLTRGLQMGDRWVSPETFLSVRQRGARGIAKVRAAGLDSHGRLMYRRLDVEWLPADPDAVVIMPGKGGEVTISMQSPALTTLRVSRGELSEILTLQTTYDERNDLTQLVISRGDPPMPRR